MLSDSEIAKALEESVSFDEPYESNFTLIRIEYIKYALDLINRYEEKNSNLTSDLTSLQNNLTSLQAENERLQNAYKQCAWERDAYIEVENTAISEARAEAYKEFAKRLKENFEPLNSPLLNNRIDNLLKELIGE